MRTARTYLILVTFTFTGCGIKGAPMPRRDEVFIEKTLIESPSVEDEEKNKTTILPKKDPR